MMNISKNEVWTFIKPENGEKEIVERLDWEWQAIYRDGTILKQFDDNHIFHQIKEIKQQDVHMIRIVGRVSDRKIDIIWNHRKKFIYFVRNIYLNNGSYKMKVYFFGYEGFDSKYLMAVFPNGDITQLENPDALSFEFYE